MFERGATRLCRLALVVALAVVPRAQQTNDEPPLVVLLSWDGMPARVLEAELARGRLPNVARLAAAGARAEASIGNYPSVTAAGHAAVLTGCTSDIHGITGNMVRREGEILDYTSGFSAAGLRAEPIWVCAARQGRRVLSVSATQSQPFARHLEAVPPGMLRMVDGFGAYVDRGTRVMTAADAHGSVREVDADTTRWIGIDQLPRPWRELDLPILGVARPVLIAGRGRDARMAIGSGERPVLAQAIVLAPDEPSMTSTAAFSPPLCGGGGVDARCAHLRLLEVSPEGDDFLLWRSRVAALGLGCTSRELAETLIEVAGAFTGNADLHPGFGPALPEGGDGLAERRYVECALLVNQWFRRATVWAIEEGDADVVLTYSPLPDEAFHMWYGLIDPESPAFQPELATRVRPLVDAILDDLDRGLGAILDALEASGRRWNVALYSDHGMTGVARTFYPNRLLAQAGLLVLDRYRQPILARSRAVYDPAGNTSIVVLDDDREKTLAEVAALLLGHRDDETGAAVVTGAFRAEDYPAFGIQAPWCGDLYLEVARGYALSSSFAGPQADGGPVVEARAPYQSGDHRYLPWRRDLESIAVLGGDDIRDLGTIGRIRSVDVVPTMCAAVGLEPPADARGHVLGELLLSERAHR